MITRNACMLAIGFAACLFTAPSVQAQCVECAQQMFQATLTTNSWSSANQVRNNDTRREDARKGVCYDANRNHRGCEGRPSGRQASPSEHFNGKLPDWTTDEAMKQVINTLKPEYLHRQRQYGTAAASRWLNTASGDIARQMATLTPEFFRRWEGSGDRRNADQWYLGQVQTMVRRYLGAPRSNGMGEAAYLTHVPPATRQRAEDATLDVLTPEIQRLERTQGQPVAMAWARDMGLAVGGGVRNLAPEYLLRLQAEGPAQADRWYIEQATSLARLQVRYAR